MRVLWFNWRDIKNSEAGGAEVLTHEIAARLVQKRNYQITLFTAQFRGGLSSENIDGVNIIREGGRYTVYNKAKSYYNKNKNNFDLVIDEINVRPFLTPKFVNEEKPLVALIHQISPEQFLLELPFPMSYIGHYYEKKWLSHYKNIPTITVSNSTKNDLEKLGFKKIFIIPEGLSTTPLPTVPDKEPVPTIVFIGRLKKHKLPHHAILAFSTIKKQIPNARLWVIGDGYMRKELQKSKIKDVTFYGRVDSLMKYKLLSKAHLAVVPAIREGWGLVVVECNSMGTPVVAYDVPGLRDSVKNGETGVLIKDKSPASLAISVICILKDNHLLSRLSSNALSFSRQFSWDTSSDVFHKIINNIAIT